MRPGTVLLALALAVPGGIRAQSTIELLDQGITAYRNLDYPAAAEALGLAVAQAEARGEAPSVMMEALTYLGATHVFRGFPDTAAVYFRRLVLTQPRYRLDELLFPPEVTLVFDAVRREVSAATVDLRRESRVPLDTGVVEIPVYASSPHDINAGIVAADGRVVSVLHRGAMGDSIVLRWEPRDTAGRPLPPGEYVLSVASRDSTGFQARVVTVPLRLRIQMRDTLDYPAPLPESVFLPERAPTPTGIKAVPLGLAAAAGVLILPPILAPGADLSAARIMVVGGISIASLVGFLNPPPGPPLPRNIEANADRRDRWARDVESVRRENAVRYAAGRFVITAGEVLVADYERP